MVLSDVGSRHGDAYNRTLLVLVVSCDTTVTRTFKLKLSDDLDKPSLALATEPC